MAGYEEWDSISCDSSYTSTLEMRSFRFLQYLVVARMSVPWRAKTVRLHTDICALTEVTDEPEDFRWDTLKDS